jgi:hypothetical protein
MLQKKIFINYFMWKNKSEPQKAQLWLSPLSPLVHLIAIAPTKMYYESCSDNFS